MAGLQSISLINITPGSRHIIREQYMVLSELYFDVLLFIYYVKFYPL